MASASSPHPIPLHSTFTHTTTTHTHSLHYTTLGSPSSPPLIFIHGTPWSSLVWTPFALSLAQRFHVHLFDNPGFGSSPLGTPLHPDRITEEERIDADLRDQSAVFAALYKFWARSWEARWGGKAHVIAHDHGGLMALRANLLHGCDYASLCLIDVVAIAQPGGEKKGLFTLVAENPGLFERLEGGAWEGLVEGYIRDAAHGRLSEEVLGQLKERWTERGEEGRKAFVRQLVGAAGRRVDEVEGRYGELGRRMPVRVIWGKEERWVPVETAGRLAEVLGGEEAGVEVRIIEEANHLIMYDQPARLGVELGLWLGDVAGR